MASERRRAGLAAEARRLMEDPAYVREAQEVAALMEELRGPLATEAPFENQL